MNKRQSAKQRSLLKKLGMPFNQSLRSCESVGTTTSEEKKLCDRKQRLFGGHG